MPGLGRGTPVRSAMNATRGSASSTNPTQEAERPDPRSAPARMEQASATRSPEVSSESTSADPGTPERDAGSATTILWICQVPTCKAECKTERALGRHWVTTHEDYPRKFQCRHCNYQNHRPSAIRRHTENQHRPLYRTHMELEEACYRENLIVVRTPARSEGYLYPGDCPPPRNVMDVYREELLLFPEEREALAPQHAKKGARERSNEEYEAMLGREAEYLSQIRQEAATANTEAINAQEQTRKAREERDAALRQINQLRASVAPRQDQLEVVQRQLRQTEGLLRNKNEENGRLKDELYRAHRVIADLKAQLEQEGNVRRNLGAWLAQLPEGVVDNAPNTSNTAGRGDAARAQPPREGHCRHSQRDTSAQAKDSSKDWKGARPKEPRK